MDCRGKKRFRNDGQKIGAYDAALAFIGRGELTGDAGTVLGVMHGRQKTHRTCDSSGDAAIANGVRATGKKVSSE